jgi:hypothetical protein
MCSGDANRTYLTKLLKEQFNELVSGDVEGLMQQLFDLDALEEASCSLGRNKRKEVNRGLKDANAHL